MEGISDIKIVGTDAKRPPQLRKEPYINLFFVLSHQAPAAWCVDFNRLTSTYKYPAKIDDKQGTYIDTWVRSIDEIAPQLTRLKETVKQCIDEYIAKINAATSSGTVQVGSKESAEQQRLNEVVARLNYDD